MSDQQPCDATSSATTRSSSQSSQTPQPDESGKSGKKKQKKQYETASGAGETPARFRLYDLKLLTFKPIGESQEVDVWHATPEQFHAFVSQFAGGFGKVNTALWPLAERLAFVNAAWHHFQQIAQPFPFTQQQHLVPDAISEHVPDVDAPASQAKREESVS